MATDDLPRFVPPQWVPFLRAAADVVRHALPLVPLYAFHGNLTGYAVLTAFDLSLGLMLIVGTTRDPKDPTSVDPRSRWLLARIAAVVVIAIFLALTAAIVALPIAAPAMLIGLIGGVSLGSLAQSPGFWGPIALMSLLAAVRAQLAFESVTTAGRKGAPTRDGPVIGDLQGDRRMSLAAKAAQITIIATFVLLCYLLSVFGLRGLYVLPLLFTALLVFYDLRPDLGQRVFPQLWTQR